MKFIRTHLEWVVFSLGLLLLGIMSPENTGISFCLFDFAGFSFCPGEGLGHSIAYTFRGDFSSAINAHILGPAAVLILTYRIIFIWRGIYQESTKTNKTEGTPWLT